MKFKGCCPLSTRREDIIQERCMLIAPDEKPQPVKCQPVEGVLRHCAFLGEKMTLAM